MEMMGNTQQFSLSVSESVSDALNKHEIIICLGQEALLVYGNYKEILCFLN